VPDALNAINLRDTPQSQPADPRQLQNSAGGYTFTVAPLERLRRFLVLGIDGGTYYAAERDLTKANAEVGPGRMIPAGGPTALSPLPSAAAKN